MKHRWKYSILVLPLLAAACGSLGESSPVSEELLPTATYEPETSATQPPARPAGEAVEDRWALWTEGTRLRGANMHPCRITVEDDCAEFVTRQDLQDLRDLGANLVVLSYPGIYAQQPPYEVEPRALAALDEAVSWAEEVGIYVVILFRTGPGRNEGAFHDAPDALYEVWTDQAAHEAWVGMWRFAAERYGNSPVVAGYNIFGEPHVNILVDPEGDLEQEAVVAEVEGTLMDWNAFAAEITAAIREVDTETPIIVDSLHWASVYWFPVVQPTGDSRTVYAFHGYDPDLYTHQDETETGVTYPSIVSDGQESIRFDREWLEETIQPAVAFAEQYDVPIFVGETGSLRWVPGVEAFHRDQTALYEQYGWNYAYYVWRGDEAYFDGFNLEYGTDPGNHAPIPDNSLLGVYLQRWTQNVRFP